MAYDKLSAADVKQWDSDYEALRIRLQNETDDAKKTQLADEMQSLAGNVQARLRQDIQAVRRYSQTRRRNVDKFVAEAQAELKRARAAAAAFKKKPAKTELPAQIKQSLTKIADLEHAFQDDGLAYAAAWMEYQGSPVTRLPEKVVRTFLTVQAKVVDEEKNRALRLQKIIAAQHQTEALLAITDKAAMKAGIKRGTGAQRPLADAQKAAGDLAAQMAALLHGLHNPDDLSAQPAGITGGKDALEGALGEAEFFSQPNALKTARGHWLNVQLARKLMTARAANMAKVLAIKSKGFRNAELADPLVKAELKKAAQCVKAAKKEIKNREADYAAAEQAMDKLETRAKKLKRK